MNSTPIQPPMSASMKIREYSKGKPMKMSAGRVKIAPAATDSPADPAVWTMLFSRIVALPKARFSGMGCLPVTKNGGYIDHQPITRFTNMPTGL